MKTKNLLFLAGVLWLLQSCVDTENMKQKPIDIANMDLSVNPGDDFNLYANGGWKKNNPIPEDKSRYGAFDALADENEKQVKELVVQIANGTHEKGSVDEKIATFYNTGMDTAKIEELGLQPLEEDFAKIDALASVSDVQQMIQLFHKRYISAGFGIYGSADQKNSDMVISYLYQSGLGLPDRDYYLSDAERFVEIRTKYLTHLENSFKLMGENESIAKDYASRVMDMETRFAKASMDRLDKRDPHKTYNKRTFDELKNETKNFNWETYFNAIGIGNPGEVIVSQPDFIAEFDKMLVETSIDDWKIYFKWHLLNDASNYLSEDFVNESFDFYGKVLSGTPELRPRWKRVLNATNSSLSEAVGQVYVKKYFPPEAKERMLKLVENLHISLGERMKNLEWMGEDTKKNGLEKLAAISVKIGYPDKWKDYSELQVENDAYILNMYRASEFGFKEMIAKINKAVDKAEWHMPPQMVNAYYSPTMNEIVFPAAILQPPFFYKDGDDAVNYGAIGVVIGHETTHGFDDKGRYYDKDGNLNTWWTDEDAERFNARAEVLVNQFNSFVVLDSVYANGKYTLGENIADLGGVNIAYNAFKKTEQWKNQQEKIDGFTPDQRFFLAYSHVWASNIRDKEALRRAQDDVHSMGRHRVVGPLRNVPEFHAAFNIKPDQFMYLAKEERAEIW
ncbi:MAG: M13 family metallopeptidase [Salinivirgaceae bacterium]|nr:M13 family metallopeptidase [Salinivirgaceae bacterium]